MKSQRAVLVVVVLLGLGFFAVSYQSLAWFMLGLAVPTLLVAVLQVVPWISSVEARPRSATWRPWVGAGGLVAASVAAFQLAAPLPPSQWQPTPSAITFQATLDYPAFSGSLLTPPPGIGGGVPATDVRMAAYLDPNGNYAIREAGRNFSQIEFRGEWTRIQPQGVLRLVRAIDTRLLLDLSDSTQPRPLLFWTPERRISSLSLTLRPGADLRMFFDTTRVSVGDSVLPSRYAAAGIGSRKTGYFLLGVEMMPLGASRDGVVQAKFLDGSMILGLLCDSRCAETTVEVRGLPRGSFYEARDAEDAKWDVTYYGAEEFVRWRMAHLNAGVAFTYVVGPLRHTPAGVARFYLWASSWPHILKFLAALGLGSWLFAGVLVPRMRAGWSTWRELQAARKRRAGFRTEK